jgi:predicted dehydrogenase
MTPLRIAVVGTGHLGRIHARLAAQLPTADLVGIVDPVQSTREMVAAETGTRGVASLRDLIGAIDGAIVATPTSTHLEVASELLRSGVHVLVEKPIASNLVDSESLVRLASHHNRVLQVGHVERFNPAFTAVRDKLSDPKFISAIRASGYTFRSTDVGVVMDLMIHDIDAILSLVRSPVVDVEAIGVSVLGDHEDMVHARLRFESGCIATIIASRVSYEPQRTMQVFTSRSFAAIDFGSRTATLVEPSGEILNRAFQVGDLSPEQQQDYREHLFSKLLVQSKVAATDVNAIEQEQKDFLTTIREGCRPVVDGADGRDAVAVAERVLASVESHQWDGSQLGRQGPFAMPALPVLGGAEHWFTDKEKTPQRKAG